AAPHRTLPLRPQRRGARRPGPHHVHGRRRPRLVGGTGHWVTGFRAHDAGMPGNVAPLTDERALLLAYIAQQRDAVRNAAFGLTDEQARLAPTAGTLTIGGLVTHV